MTSNSFIKLYRSMLDWEWWEDQNVTRLFLTMLLMCNWKDKQWQGVEIKSGSFFTSLDHLSKKSGLSVRQVRTALNKLKSTGEVTSEATKKGTLITLANWAKFQGSSQTATNEMTNDVTRYRQTSDKRATNERQQLKKDKNNKKDNNYKNDISNPVQSIPEGVNIGDRYTDPVTGRLRMRVR